MKKFIFTFLLLLSPLLAHALEVPPLRGYVNDYAGMLSRQTAQRLETVLSEFEKSDSTQMVVLTIPSLEGESLEDFSIKVAETWKIGWKGKDNGAILLVVKNERKIRIEVGRGLEGKLTDLVSGRIIRNEIVPRFKSADFDGGIEQGISSMVAVAKGEYSTTPQEEKPARRSAPPVFTFFIFFLVACVFLGAISKILGGLAGAAGLSVIAYMMIPGIALLLLPVIALVGFVVGLLLTFLFGGGGRGGYFGGGPFAGGGFGGGSFGGDGGFSGGGGSFGGGGASGDW